MGLADVQLIFWTLAAACLAKAISDVYIRNAPATLGALWTLAAALLLVRPRVGAAVASVVAFGSMALWSSTSHTSLVGWVGLVVATLDRDDAVRTLRVLAMTVYGFAVANKIVGGVFLAGLPITRITGWTGTPVVLMVGGTLAAQMWMVWALARRDWTAVPVALAMHVGITVGMAMRPDLILELLVFNGLMVAVVWAVARAYEGAPA